jgi:hypothetical protein
LQPLAELHRQRQSGSPDIEMPVIPDIVEIPVIPDSDERADG